MWRRFVYQKPEELYLELLKKTLTFSLWPEPPVDLSQAFWKTRRPIRQRSIMLVQKILKRKSLQLCKQRSIGRDRIEQGRYWPSYAHTMIGLRRLDNIQHCVETVLRERVEGDLIETGVWRGGACILMRGVLAAYGINDRKVYLADSFEGLPKPDVETSPIDHSSKLYQHDFLANFEKYDLLDSQVVFLKGWFKDTLPLAPIDKLAVLRLDGDMYGSTMEALSSLYSKLSAGGFCIIDDYGDPTLPGCKAAVDDFRRENGIYEPIESVDWTGVYWRKEQDRLL
jgi:O-methyltransferase